MKKIGFSFISQLIFGLAGAGLMIGGAIMSVASFLTSEISLFHGVVLISLGIIILCCVKLYFTFLETINIAADGIEKITNATENYKSNNGRIYRPQDYFATPDVHHITIDENTPPDEIQKIKENFPDIADSIDNLVGLAKNIKQTESPPLYIKMMSMSQLEKELKEAVAAENYERATAIRNEIKSR